jgi:hypothetical protein
LKWIIGIEEVQQTNHKLIFHIGKVSIIEFRQGLGETKSSMGI